MEAEPTKEDFIAFIYGNVKIPPYQVAGLIGKYINRANRSSTVREIAETITQGYGVWDTAYMAERVDPDLDEDARKQQMLEMMVEAAALTVIEGLKAPWHKGPIREKDVVEKYANEFGVLHIDCITAEKLIKEGIRYHKMVRAVLEGKDITKRPSLRERLMSHIVLP